jgi:hypothetical protein
VQISLYSLSLVHLPPPLGSLLGPPLSTQLIKIFKLLCHLSLSLVVGSIFRSSIFIPFSYFPNLDLNWFLDLLMDFIYIVIILCIIHDPARLSFMGVLLDHFIMHFVSLRKKEHDPKA